MTKAAISAEQEARAACEGLGFNEEQIQAFVAMHTTNEARRARSAALTDAIISVAVSPWRERSSLATELFQAFKPCSRGFDAEDEESARLDRQDRTKECNR